MQQLPAVIVLVLAVTSSVSGAPVYPKFSHVFNDPGSYDLLYNAASGTVNETLRFTRGLRLTSVVAPSQIIDFASQGSYDEDVTVRVFQTVLSSNHAQVKTTQVASGRFLGKARYGQELLVPVHVDAGEDVSEPPTMAVFYNGDSGSQYIVSYSFGKAGIYPWYNLRKFSTSASVHPSCDVAGFMIGLSYSLV